MVKSRASGGKAGDPRTPAPTQASPRFVAAGLLPFGRRRGNMSGMESFARAILVAALLGGFSASGWMRQCCAAGCRARLAAQAEASAAAIEDRACCDGCRDTPAVSAPAEPEPCCPFGDECRDEARRSQGNPPAPGEDRSGADEVPAAPVERVGPVSAGPTRGRCAHGAPFLRRPRVRSTCARSRP